MKRLALIGAVLLAACGAVDHGDFTDGQIVRKHYDPPRSIRVSTCCGWRYDTAPAVYYLTIEHCFDDGCERRSVPVPDFVYREARVGGAYTNGELR